MTITLGRLNEVQELLFHVFNFNTFKENVKNTLVCKLWNAVASEVAKRQLLTSAIYQIKSIEPKFSTFLKITTLDLGHYIPTFAKLNVMKNKHLEYSIKEVFDQCNSFPKIEKATVCMAKFFTIDPNCQNIPDEKKEALAGKTFVSLHMKSTDASSGGNAISKFPNDHTYFPIELFNLTVNDQDQTIIRKTNCNSILIPHRGNLIDLTIIEGDQETKDANFIGISELNSNTTTMITDIAKDDDVDGHIWVQDLYIPETHAASTVITLEDSENDFGN